LKIFVDETLEDIVDDFLREEDAIVSDPEDAEVIIGFEPMIADKILLVKLDNGRWKLKSSGCECISGDLAFLRAKLELERENKTFNQVYMPVAKYKKMVGDLLKSMVVTMEVEDQDGQSHTQRVTKLCEEFARYLGLSPKVVNFLKDAVMLHDVGRIGLEQLMLYTPTRMRVWSNYEVDHTIVGSIFLSTLEYFEEYIPIVRSHHERWDGKGYPDGLSQKDIPFLARLVAVVDSYDWMVNTASSEFDGGPLSKEEALEEIKSGAGTAYDPELAMKFIEFMRRSDE